MPLNGWRRLWIVVVSLGLLYGIWFALNEAANQYALEGGVLLGFDRPQCVAVVQMPAGSKLSPEPGYGDLCWDLYLYRSIYNDARATKDGYIEHRNSLQRTRILQNLAFVGIVWVAAAALLYFSGVVVAWVLRGFRRDA
jgi:hypothetical protein